MHPSWIRGWGATVRVSRPSFGTKELHTWLLEELSVKTLSASVPGEISSEESWLLQVPPSLGWPASNVSSKQLYTDLALLCQHRITFKLSPEEGLAGMTKSSTETVSQLDLSMLNSSFFLFLPWVLTLWGSPISLLNSNLHLWVSFLEKPTCQKF